ncbi:hypothetical protein GCM10028806_31610 [Spirosoma terrae]|uniref:Uncharacterized protein n=1 Tax=Spirosoma terrae TaxID=1968276 RepID=A0A6L9L487_9BACT|nr:hypothetical protein [Spirosoma terrae]NDU95475.1 hypothetical protein [Spirosoma terrae]
MTITFDDQSPSYHDDLYVKIPELNLDRRFDTYFFALDLGYSSIEESIEKVKIVLKDLLENWAKAIKTAKVGETVYLPIDFSDQSVGALKVSKEANNRLTIRYSSHKIVCMFPSFMAEAKFAETETSTQKQCFEVSMASFLDELEREYSKIYI